jgi:kojibiose phosphorylase
VIAKLYSGYDPHTHLFEQFEGYFQLEDIDLPSLEPRTKSVQALLGIQAAQTVQVIKQPDVLMLLYLLESEYDLDIRQANWDYYTPRTDLTYGSSLGPSIQAAMAARLGDPEAAYAHFMRAALTDLDNARGNSVDGFHAATAGGVWQTVVFGFAGIDPTGRQLLAHPHLPKHITRLRFQLMLQGKPHHFDLVREGDRVIDRASAASGSGRRFPILGAIFDLDGVLTDTSEFHYQAWKRLAGEEGVPFNRQENEALRGIPRRESLLLLLKGRPVSEEHIVEMMERKNHYYLESVEKITPANLLPGAVQLLKELKGKGIRVAIGSASKNAVGVIERLGIGSLVDAISDGYSVEHQKPAPDLFLHAATQLHIPPGQCVVFEDAAAGVEAALAGGMWAVGIGPEERVSAADVVIPNLAGIHWDALNQHLKRGNEEKSP